MSNYESFFVAQEKGPASRPNARGRADGVVAVFFWRKKEPSRWAPPKEKRNFETSANDSKGFWSRDPRGGDNDLLLHSQWRRAIPDRCEVQLQLHGLFAGRVKTMAQRNLMQMQCSDYCSTWGLSRLKSSVLWRFCNYWPPLSQTSSCLQDAANNEVFDTLCGISWYPLPLDILVLTWIGLTRKRSWTVCSAHAISTMTTSYPIYHLGYVPQLEGCRRTKTLLEDYGTGKESDCATVRANPVVDRGNEWQCKTHQCGLQW